MPPGIGIGLAEAPVALEDDPRAQVYVIDHVEPGTTFTRRIRVSNGTDDRVTLDLYAVAADITGGSFVVREGRTPNELSDWISVRPFQVTLPPGTIEEAAMTVSVPADASRGERYATVVAELPAAAAGGGLAIGQRVGIRVYLSVGPGGAPPSDFRIDALTARRSDDGAPMVDATVTNTGERALDLRGELWLEDGPAGLRAGPFPARLGTTLAPGDSAPVVVPLDPELPPGPWLATLSLRSGLLERSAQATIVFPEAVGEVAEPVAADPVERQKRLLVPLAGGLLLLAIIALLVVLFFLWKRRRDEDDDDPPPPAAAGRREVVGAGRR